MSTTVHRSNLFHMRKCAVPLLVLILLVASPAIPESSSDQIVMYRLKEGNVKDIRLEFLPHEKIYADFTFLPEERQTGVEFRWINPLNKKEQSYFEIVRSPIPPKKQTVLCWLLLQPSLTEKIIGSKFLGQWRLEIWVNNRLRASKAFKVGN